MATLDVNAQVAGFQVGHVVTRTYSLQRASALRGHRGSENVWLDHSPAVEMVATTWHAG